jgi:DNA-binding transcriptional LysR family regulator
MKLGTPISLFVHSIPEPCPTGGFYFRLDRAVQAGLGIAVASLPAFSEDFDSGELLPLLPDWSLNDIEAHALFASGQAAKPAARAFVDHLVQELRSV